MEMRILILVSDFCFSMGLFTISHLVLKSSVLILSRMVILLDGSAV